MPEKNERDWMAIAGALIAFGLPLTLLVPGFSLWDVVPKVNVKRFHLISKNLSWFMTNAVIVSLLVILFSLYLEIRKRKLDDMVHKVLCVTKATDTTMQLEDAQQEDAVRVCLELLDTSAQHYENLMLLRDNICKNEKASDQHPPAVESSIFQ